jgi:hypothetical protein
MAHLLDTVLVCAVATILFVRTDLYLTHYPQLGGHGLHIAHLLWGGMLMLIAIGLLLAFVSPAVRPVASVFGGIGLGLFLDELGKFVTADNNYFFRPTAAIIYCFFVVCFLVVRQLERRRELTAREYLVNAIELVKEAALHDMTEVEQRRALVMLGRADRSDPLVPQLHRLIEQVHSRPAGPPPALRRTFRRARDAFYRLVDRSGMAHLTIAFFAFWAAASLLQIVGLIMFTATGLHPGEEFTLGRDVTSNPLGPGEHHFIEWADLAASLVATGLVLAGLYRSTQGRTRAALELFERALLVSIFLTQVFAFVHSEFAAVFGFAVDLVLFVIVRALLNRELEDERLGEPSELAAVPEAEGLPA